MKKIDCCGNCEYFDSNNDKLGICTNYESDRIGYLLPFKHYCQHHVLAKEDNNGGKCYEKQQIIS